MPVYPGDIDVNLTKEKDFNKDGYNNVFFIYRNDMQEHIQIHHYI